MEEGLLEILREAVEFVKLAAPEVWGLAWRQAIVEAVQSLIWALVVVGGSIASLKTGLLFLRKASDARSDSMREFDNRFGAILLLIVGVILAPVGASLINSFVGRVVNPGYYAIQSLISLMR